MLSLPDWGVRPSTNKHNCDLDAICDWIEASVLFLQEKVTRSDVVDILLEEEVYSTDTHAGEFADVALGVVRQRVKSTATRPPLVWERSGLRPALEWDAVPAYSFCLAVALRPVYRTWSKRIKKDYVAQGDLFERVTAEAFAGLGWEAHRIGWGGVNSDQAFNEAVERIADRLNETSNGLAMPPQTKDAGVDIVCLRRFPDNLGGHPFFLVQCGSGENWVGKCGALSLDLWRALITFTIPPMKALAVPFSFAESAAFYTRRLQTQGLLMDRYRILSVGLTKKNWVSLPLSKELVQWLTPAIDLLPTYD